jgi:hypothetical protein
VKRPTTSELASAWGISYQTACRWRQSGAPIHQGAKEVLGWWHMAFDKGIPPRGLLLAAVREKQEAPKAKGGHPRIKADARPIAPKNDEPADLEELAEAGRRQFTMAQRRLDAAYAAGADDVTLERCHGAVDRAAALLARVERLALANRPLDPRWVEIPRVREIFDRLHTGLNDRLFAIAEAHSPDPTALRAAWDAAVARFIADPFEAGATAA